MNTRNPDHPFEVKLGRIRSASGHQRVTGFLKSVGRRAQPVRRRTGGSQSRASTNTFQRRVMVKVSIVRMDGTGIGAQRQHLKYIQRDSAAPGEERGSLYDRRGRDVDVKAFEQGGKDDRHQFRIIVSPEDSARLSDLSAFTRDLISEMETDLGTKLEWVAADHYDTGQPHTHIVIRGTREDGSDLVMPKTYVAHGIRERAQALVELELGPVPEIEGRQRFARMVQQSRLTALDRDMMRHAKDGVIDLSAPVRRGQLWRRQLQRMRLKQLHKMGLAEPLGKGQWRPARHAAETLTRMGERGDIIKTMHRAMKTYGLRRVDGNSFYDPSAEAAKPVTGRILAKGIGDDVSGRAFMVLDTVEGRSAYVEIGSPDRLDGFTKNQIVTVVPPPQTPRPSDYTIEKIARENGGKYSPRLHMENDSKARPEYVQAHIRRLEALRRAGHVTRHKDGSWTLPPDYLDRASQYERASALSRPVQIERISQQSLRQMEEAIGATWLDHDLKNAPDRTYGNGFGREVDVARARRVQFLLKQGLLVKASEPMTDQVLDELRERDLKSAGETLSRENGKAYRAAPSSGRLSGQYRGSVERPSGKFAIIERAKDYTLVPWRDVLEGQRGKAISGWIRGKTISWRFGKSIGIP